MAIRSKLAGFLILAAGCTAARENPSFPISVADAKSDLARMRNQPRPTTRPIVVLGGFADPGIGGACVSGELHRNLDQPQVVCVSFMFCRSFDDCRRKVIEAVDRQWPSDDPAQTVKVDVIGLSMGGLVGRYCAADLRSLGGMGASSMCLPGSVAPNSTGEAPVPRINHGKRLRVRRMFTVSSPHQGATRAQQLPRMTQMQADMRPGSKFLSQLESAEKAGNCEIVPYVCLGDRVVGEQHASPPGMNVWWVPRAGVQPSHIGAATDPRILADIVRRLRGEPPLTTEPATKLPG